VTAKLYVFAGAPKCGSTWMYEQLRRHPDVTVARIKDPFYFDRHHTRGDDWYWALFGLRGAAAASGVYADLSHDYLYDPEFPTRCAATAAGRGVEPYIHVVLRNPLDRLLSAVRYQISFEGSRRPGALQDAYPKMVAESQYSEHVARLLTAFPAGRVRVDLFEDLAADPEGLMSEICGWLSIVSEGGWLDSSPSRARRAPRRPTLALRARRAGVFLRRAGLVRVVERAKESTTAERFLFRTMENGDEHADPIGEVDLDHVTAVLRLEVRALSRILDRDLETTWGLGA
jgi:hypothetical protein